MIKLDTSDFDEWLKDKKAIGLNFCVSGSPNNYAEVVERDTQNRFPKLVKINFDNKPEALKHLNNLGNMHTNGLYWIAYNRKLYIIDRTSMISYKDKKISIPIITMGSQTMSMPGIRNLLNLDYRWCMSDKNIKIIADDPVYKKNRNIVNDCAEHGKKLPRLFVYLNNVYKLDELLTPFNDITTYANFDKIEKLSKFIVRRLNALYGNHFELKFEVFNIDEEVY